MPSHGGNLPRLAPVANGGAFFETPFHYRGTKMLGRALVQAMTFNAIRYRTYFEDARKRAEQSADPVEKQAWIRMAEKWLKLLALADKNASRAVGVVMKEATH
jgi:hypothetical protein